MSDYALLLLNVKGEPLAVVAPFPDQGAAIDFYQQTASPAYHGYTIVSGFTPESYSEPA